MKTKNIDKLLPPFVEIENEPASSKDEKAEKRFGKNCYIRVNFLFAGELKKGYFSKSVYAHTTSIFRYIAKLIFSEPGYKSTVMDFLVEKYKNMFDDKPRGSKEFIAYRQQLDKEIFGYLQESLFNKKVQNLTAAIIKYHLADRLGDK